MSTFIIPTKSPLTAKEKKKRKGGMEEEEEEEEYVEFSRLFDQSLRKDKRRRKRSQSLQLLFTHNEEEDDVRKQLLLEVVDDSVVNSSVPAEVLHIATGLNPYEDIAVVIENKNAESKEDSKKLSNGAGTDPDVLYHINTNGNVQKRCGKVPVSVLSKMPTSLCKRLPPELIFMIFSFLHQGLVEQILEAICLALTSRCHWAQFRALYCDPGTNHISKKYELPYMGQLCLSPLLITWMGPKYRQSTPYKENEVVHRPIPMFLSRAVYGNKCGDAEERLKLRYQDCARIINDFGPRSRQIYYQNPSGLITTLPSPFGLGEAWYFTAATFYRDLLWSWRDNNLHVSELLGELLWAIHDGSPTPKPSKKRSMSHHDSWTCFQETHLWRWWVEGKEEDEWDGDLTTKAGLEAWERKEVKEDLEMIRRCIFDRKRQDRAYREGNRAIEWKGYYSREHGITP
ncbi:hypothetical protein NHQ30_011532 [Ciborinia camelliae]|nr:hypothetical protein NHQ30_011532 [Ciborinia camelliae]